MKERSNRFKEFMRVVFFTLVSASAAIVQLGSFAIFNDLIKMGYWPSYLISLLLSVVWNFTINRKITFKSANNVKIAMLLVLAFYAVFTPISTILGDLATDAGIHDYIVLIVTMLSNLVLEYLYTRFVVYNKTCDTATKKSENPENGTIQSSSTNVSDNDDNIKEN